MTPRRHAAPVHLTRRERQVVHLIVEGCSNQEIARRLRIQCQTVKNQLSQIYIKIGVSSRVQLAVYAVRNGVEGEPALPGRPPAATPEVPRPALRPHPPRPRR